MAPDRSLRVHSVPTPAEQVRTAVEIAAIVAAGIWALYTFVYEQRIKPLSEPASFSVPTTVDQTRAANGVVFLTIHKQVQNTGNVGIDLAAETLSVYGEQIVPRSAAVSRFDGATYALASADVQRKPVKLLYSVARLRSGAIGGNQNVSFYVPPHSAGDEKYLVAVRADAYPVVLVARKDYIVRPAIDPKIRVKIVRTPLGGYDLQSSSLLGEYDSENEYPIR